MSTYSDASTISTHTTMPGDDALGGGLERERFKDRERQLDERERKLDKRERWLDKRELSSARQSCTRQQQQQASDDVASPTDVLHLNIGGCTNVAVLRQTLTLMPSSLLASQFSGRWDESLAKDRDGNFFLDTSPDLFLPLINFLRAKSMETLHSSRVKPPTPTEDFLRLLEYYNLTLAVYQMELVPLTMMTEEQHPAIESLRHYPEFSVATSDFLTFDLVPVRHDRAVHSFSIQLGATVERAQIGWRRDSSTSSRDSTRLLLEGAFDQKGIGDVENTLALDCVQGGILNDGGSIIPLKPRGIKITRGSVVRCVSGDEKLELYVDNAPIDLGLLALKTSGRNIPCFSVHGQVYVTAIEFKEPL